MYHSPSLHGLSSVPMWLDSSPINCPAPQAGLHSFIPPHFYELLPSPHYGGPHFASPLTLACQPHLLAMCFPWDRSALGPFSLSPPLASPQSNQPFPSAQQPSQVPPPRYIDALSPARPRCEFGELAQSVSAPFQRTNDGIRVPLVLRCTKERATTRDVVHWVKDNAAKIEHLIALYGAVILRGFPIPDATAFSDVVCAFDAWEDLPYEASLSYAVRLPVAPRVCTTNEGKTGGMVFHHEQAQAPLFPTKLLFYCYRQAPVGGATAICRSDAVLARVASAHPEFVARLRALGVRYTATLPGEQDASKGAGRSWKSFFSVSTREEAEKRMAELGYEWEWDAVDADMLQTTTPVLPGICTAPCGKEVFFNQIVAHAFGNVKDFLAQRGCASDATSSGAADANAEDARMSVAIGRHLTFGDGSPMPLDALHTAKAACDDEAIELVWQNGDVGILDNLLVMHARRPFEGPRKVYASLIQ
eukprot:TRINITY_DN70345_c0_g1_i1.p1 TRINITY_DN70345_c0_g1~~TRINITY_DN70345_c0_g1_i1.p1  ORF type:complete len:475 (+),score=59.46 TRINITY_DN70345_c0_g1_i1:201-1625(+)